jgi:23S rRNA (adenine2503-C2)-methyltransferase
LKNRTIQQINPMIPPLEPATPSIYDCEQIDEILKRRDVLKKIQAACLRYLYQCTPPQPLVTKEVFRLCEEFTNTRQHRFLDIESISNSKVDQSTKILFKTFDGHLIESVILRSLRLEKNSLCVSSQVGCTEKCHFCATGSLPFKRNLSKDEILDQVMIMRRILHAEGRQLTHVVFMGMGEPLRNLEAVSASLSALVSMRHFQISPRAITVSTLGIPTAMETLVRRHPLVNLALSLHAPNDELRTKIMPINAKHSIADLLLCLEKCEPLHNRNVMVSYILFQGLNDHSEQAQQLADLFKQRRIIFNLIPFNSISQNDEFRRCDEVQMNVFKRVLMANGFQVTVRRSFGPDIDAACGQLAARQVQLA